MPGFEGLVDKGIEKELIQIRKDLLGDGDVDALHSIPKTGLSQKDIVTKLKAAKVRRSPSQPKEDTLKLSKRRNMYIHFPVVLSLLIIFF